MPDGVSVEFVQLRSDVAARQAQVHVRNDTDAAIEIGDVTVTDARFDGRATRAVEGRSSTIPPGSTVDIRIQLPEMECSVEDGSMTVGLASPTLGEGLAEADLPDPLDVIGPLHDRECLAQRLAAAAQLEFASFRPSPAGVPATLSLSIAPSGQGAATIGGIQTTNLLTFATSPGDTADTLAIGIDVVPGVSDPRVVDLPLLPLRCDAHAVQEDKRGTIFTLEVVVDGVRGEIELAAPEGLRGRILTWVAEWCGFGQG